MLAADAGGDVLGAFRRIGHTRAKSQGAASDAMTNLGQATKVVGETMPIPAFASVPTMQWAWPWISGAESARSVVSRLARGSSDSGTLAVCSTEWSASMRAPCSHTAWRVDAWWKIARRGAIASTVTVNDANQDRSRRRVAVETALNCRGLPWRTVPKGWRIRQRSFCQVLLRPPCHAASSGSGARACKGRQGARRPCYRQSSNRPVITKGTASAPREAIFARLPRR
jgi:hypothetical protein